MKEQVSAFLSEKRNRVYVAIGGALVLITAGTGGVLLAKPDWSPFLTEVDKQTVSLTREERKEAENNLESALSVIPGDSVMVSHANTSSLDDVNKWWQYYLGMLMSKESLPEKLPEQYGVTSVTYAKVPLAPDSEYYGMYPFGDMLILTAPTESAEDLRIFFGDTVNSNWRVGVVPSKEDPGTTFVYISSTILGDQIEELIRDASSSFTDKAEANNFKIDRKSPTMLFDMSGYFDQLGSYVTNPEDRAFTKEFTSKVLAMEEGTIWVGDTLDGGESWGGKFLSGEINSDNLDVNAASQLIMEQVQFVPADPSDPNSSAGLADFGLAGLQDGVSVATKEGDFGAVLPRDGGDPKAAELGDNDATIEFSPGQLQSTYQGYLLPSELETVRIGIQDDDVSFSFNQVDDTN